MRNSIQLFMAVSFLWAFGFNEVLAQDQDQADEINQLKEQVKSLKPGKSRFLLRGYAHAGLEFHEDDDELSFIGGAFNPLFIYQQSDRLLFEAEVEMGFDDNEFEIGLEYANISYILNETLIVRVGKIYVPFGIFTERLHPAWINKFPNFPLGYGHDGILPGTDLGVEFRGAAHAGNVKYNYSIYAINGPQLDEGDEHEDDIGRLVYGRTKDNNKNKAFGGRVGIFPFHDSSLELGFSAQFSKVGSSNSEYEDVGSNLYAFDLSYIKAIPAMKSVIDVKAQVNFVNVDQADYPDPEDPTGMETFTFNNNSDAFFVQGSIRPSFVTSRFFQNLELAVRYSDIQTPEDAPWHVDVDQLDIGLNYWLDWRTVFKLTFRNSGLGVEESEEEHKGFGNAFFVHWAIGF